MQMIEVKCGAKHDEDGTVTLTIRVSGLHADQAARILEQFKEPFRQVLDSAMGVDGAEVIRLDLGRPVQ
jgi:capsular polysaccharide biosynthesis protein